MLEKNFHLEVMVEDLVLASIVSLWEGGVGW